MQTIPQEGIRVEPGDPVVVAKDIERMQCTEVLAVSRRMMRQEFAGQTLTPGAQLIMAATERRWWQLQLRDMRERGAKRAERASAVVRTLTVRRTPRAPRRRPAARPTPTARDGDAPPGPEEPHHVVVADADRRAP